MSEGKPPYFPGCEAIPQLEHRPPLAVSVLKRLAIKVAAPWLRPLNARRHRARQRDLEQIFADVIHCRSRDDLEAVLGQPAYAMSGHLFTISDASGKSRHPDRVEVYLVSGCTIDVLFFSEDGRFEVHGCPSPTAADVVLGFED